MITYWLYRGTHAIYCVRAANNASDEEVRAEALRQHALVPLPDPRFAALDFTALLRTASVHPH